MERDDSDQSRRRRKVEDDADKISALPDSILHEIFSSVDIRHLVQTSVLSRRWRYVWTSHPFLNLEYRSSIWEEAGNAQFRKFMNFITRFLSLRNQSCKVIRSSISVYFYATPIFLDQCITYLVGHNVEKLQIHTIGCCSETRYEFPSCFYTCESLTELDLSYNHDVALIDAKLNLPSLKKLSLQGFTFWEDNGDDSVSEEDIGLGPFDVPQDKCITIELFSLCMKLECLMLEQCDFYHLDVVSLPLLKRLDVKLKSSYSPEYNIEIKLDTPLLNSFKLEGEASVVLSTESELSCLEKVHISLHPDKLLLCDENVRTAASLNLIQMLEQLGNASAVTLAPETAEILAMNSLLITSYPPPFCGLKHLKFLEPCGYVRLPPKVLTYLTNGSSYRETVLTELPKDWQKVTRDGGEIVLKRQW